MNTQGEPTGPDRQTHYRDRLLGLPARGLLLWRRAWRGARMLVLRPAFRRHGKRFVFDPDGHYSFANIEAGDDVAIGSGAVLMASESRILIGSRVMFGPNVTIVGGDHNTSVVGRFMTEVEEKRPEDDLDVIIEDDVWVCAGAVILKGVRVGRGSIVAAGALVTKEVLPYTVVGGVPAKVISMRFRDVHAILQHENALYSAADRLSEEYLTSVVNHE